ncbi:hypothetical protein FTO68_00105 [Methanocalculus taiwanensis]|uniref:Uncharacterized protein n=1 Tax=Methanocalculus taiwanensis TaxID=106207 RepID=A0ABD4THK0_9EURY|nr:hypothetical protein [Methanocalculus taiwanensis]MCQ1537413.1 hypothetical protein [Methanocalculus taiwanensis]
MAYDEILKGDNKECSGIRAEHLLPRIDSECLKKEIYDLSLSCYNKGIDSAQSDRVRADRSGYPL